MRTTCVVVVVAALLSGSGAAFARDHQELVCTAVADGKDGGDRIPLFIHFYEGRDGMNRAETLSTVYQGMLFQAKHVNTSDGPSKRVPIALKSGEAIWFRGTYTVLSVGEGEQLRLSGEVNEDPFKGNKFRKVTASLTCVDLSI